MIPYWRRIRRICGVYTGLGPSSMVSATTFGPSRTVYMGSPYGSLSSCRGGRAACRASSGCCRVAGEVEGRSWPGVDGATAWALAEPAARFGAGRGCVPALCS